MDLTQIWWRRMTSADFLAIERDGPPAGSTGGMQTYIDVPKSGVEALAEVVGLSGADMPVGGIEVPVGVIWDPGEVAPLTVMARVGQNGRGYLARQNRFMAGSQRHPAWRASHGWPHPAPAPQDAVDVTSIIDDGLTVFLARTEGDEVLAGFTVGRRRPVDAPAALAPLFGSAASRPTVGSILDPGVSAEQLADITRMRAPMRPADVEADETEVEKRSPSPRAPVRSGGGQGYGLTAAQKKALELASVASAIAYFHGLGFSGIEDTGATNPFDLRMHKDGQEYIVEVKGSTSAAAKILLTSGEVNVHRDRHPRNFLYVLAGMTLTPGDQPTASGGTPTVIEGWWPDDEDLVVTAYRYTMPGS